uniref:Odorant receptor n=1 Tax=Lutzomyia longipalpis TaxID=7200 RepID=A0A7G3B9K8_LUTLO
MTRHLQEFINTKSVIDFSIALSTLDVFSGPLKNRLKITFLTISNVSFLYLLFSHIKKSIGAQFDVNFMWTFLMWILLNNYLVIMILNAFKRKKFHRLMQNIQEMFEDQEDDEDLEGILANNLQFFLKTFFSIDRWEKRLGFLLVSTRCLIFRFNHDYGLIADFSLISWNNVLWREIQFMLQHSLFACISYTVLTMNLGITFMGLAVIAEINILNDYMKLLNEKIKTDQKFLRKIIKKHCSVIENVNLLNEIISESSFLQLFANCVVFLFGFSFLMKNPSTFINYSIVVTGTMLSLHICILGHFIKLKTDQLSDILYLTNWYELSLKDQKMFLIVLGMAQREYGLKAVGMYDVNLYTFVQVR